MKDLGDVIESIRLLTSKPGTFGWLEFGDSGNACTGRLDVMDPDEHNQYADQHCLVLKAMQKGSKLHISLNRAVSSELGTKWVKYDILVKYLARILMSCESCDALKAMVAFTECVQNQMAIKRVTAIKSVEELFS